jgi:hypothetical protein
VPAPAPPFDGVPSLLAPVRDGGLVALTGTSGGLLGAPPDSLEQPADMPRVVGDTELQPQDRGDSAPRPHLAAETIGLGPSVQEVGKTGELLRSQSPGRASRRAMPQRLWAAIAATLHPLAHGRLADA